MLTYLGIEGVSTDESDHENTTQHPRYRIVKKSWRNDDLIFWYRTFDALHQHSRFRPVNRATRGAQPHARIPSDRSNEFSAAVSQLPRNAYDPEWLQALHPQYVTHLHIDESFYDFSHTAEIKV